MSDLDIQIPSAFDPLAEADAVDSGAGSKEYVHVRIQQRNGRKSLTTVQGLTKQYSYTKILKALKKEFCCNGTVVQDTELGQVFSPPHLSTIFQPSKHNHPSHYNMFCVYYRLSNFKEINAKMSPLSLFRPVL